jgi:hypothetical protein
MPPYWKTLLISSFLSDLQLMTAAIVESVVARAIRALPQEPGGRARMSRPWRHTYGAVMTCSVVAWLAAGVTLVSAGPACAAWTPAQTVPGVRTATLYATAVAVGGPGQVAVAWVDDGGASNGVRHAIVAVRVAVRRSDGGFATRTLTRRRDLAVQGLTAVMDARGELAMAWIDALPRGHRTVRAALRTATGRWSAVQPIGFSSAFFYAVPRLAVAPNGRVLLSYVAGVRGAPGVGVAWRQPGRRFGVLHGVGRLRIFDPVPAFDGAGRAFLSGIAQCDDESASHGVVRTTVPGGSRFGPPLTVAPAPATELRLRISGAATAVASWVGAGCSTTELLAGPIYARTITGTDVAGTQQVDGRAGRGLVLSGAAAGGAEASWTAFPASAPAGAVFAARMPGGGAFGPAAVPVDGWTALTSDPTGDQLVEMRRPENNGPPDAVGARPAGSLVVQQAPLAGPAPFVAAASGYGRRSLAAASTADGALRVSTWAPGA